MDEIDRKVIEVVTSACKASGVARHVSRDSSIFELALDSIKAVEMMFELERKFGFRGSDELLSELDTVGDLIEFIREMTLKAIR